jgi:hypothetical protein
MLTAMLCVTLLRLSMGQTATYTQAERIECPIIDVYETRRDRPQALERELYLAAGQSFDVSQYELSRAIQHCLTESHTRRAEAAAREQAKAQLEASRAEETRALDEQIAEAKARREKLRNDPAWLQISISSTRCAARADRADATTEIATEEKYSRMGGVRDLSSLNQQQQLIRQADEQIAEANSGLAQIRRPPVPCSNSLIKKILACDKEPVGGESAECMVDEIRDYLGRSSLPVRLQ